MQRRVYDYFKGGTRDLISQWDPDFNIAILDAKGESTGDYVTYNQFVDICKWFIYFGVDDLHILLRKTILYQIIFGLTQLKLG
jgi:hypothetical protein